jgi:hypothetical protein
LDRSRAGGEGCAGGRDSETVDAPYLFDRRGVGSVVHEGQWFGRLGGVGCAATFGVPLEERGQSALLSSGNQTHRMLVRRGLDRRSYERTAMEVVTSFESFQPFEDMQNPRSRRSVVIARQQKGLGAERRTFPQAGGHQLIVAAEQLVSRTR